VRALEHGNRVGFDKYTHFSEFEQLVGRTIAHHFDNDRNFERIQTLVSRRSACSATAGLMESGPAGRETLA
jgi:hypothetical protein